MYIGIDLGGTKIEGIVLDEQYKIICRKRIPTPRYSYFAILDAIQEVVNDITNEVAVDTALPIGIGTPGTLTDQGLMKNCNTAVLNGHPLSADLEKKLNRPIHTANDADCFTLSEACLGSAQNNKSIFGVILGTGVGGGIVINKTLVTGPNGICGEWGHNILPGLGTKFEDEKRICCCGRTNCIETYLSGSGLSQTYKKISNQVMDAQQIALLAGDTATNNTDALQAVNHFQLQLAYSLSQVINLLDPSAIVLGGGLSGIKSLYTEVPKLWQEFVFNDTVETRLLKAKYGDSSGVLGAACLTNSHQ